MATVQDRTHAVNGLNDQSRQAAARPIPALQIGIGRIRWRGSGIGGVKARPASGRPASGQVPCAASPLIDEPGPATGHSGVYPDGTSTRRPGPASRTQHERTITGRQEAGPHPHMRVPRVCLVSWAGGRSWRRADLPARGCRRGAVHRAAGTGRPCARPGPPRRPRASRRR